MALVAPKIIVPAIQIRPNTYPYTRNDLVAENFSITFSFGLAILRYRLLVDTTNNVTQIIFMAFNIVPQISLFVYPLQ